MISRINKLIILLLIVGLALYVVLYNSQEITLTLAPNWQLTGNAGVIFLCLFVAGVVLTSVFGVFFGIKAYFRERRLKVNDSQRKAFYQGMLRARALFAAREWHRARVEWETLVRKDPTDIIAKIEISRCLEHIGDNAEAIKIIEQARATEPKNVEVLFRAAELQKAQGNRTAAIDNLNLILEQGPNKRAANLARNLSEELGNFDSALQYQEQLEKLSGDQSELMRIRSRIEFRRIVSKFNGTQAELLEQLRVFCKKRPEFIPGLQRLAILENELGYFDEAAQAYAKAARLSASTSFWNEIAKIWVKNKAPDKAIAAARAATKETQGEAKLVAELELLRIQIQLQQFEDAQKTIDTFEVSVGSQLKSPSSDIMQEFTILKGYFFSQLGRNSEASQLWSQLAEEDYSVCDNKLIPGLAREDQAPAARLSTP